MVYAVRVLPLPDPPAIRATPYKDYIVVEWDEIRSYGNDTSNFGISKYDDLLQLILKNLPSALWGLRAYSVGFRSCTSQMPTD